MLGIFRDKANPIFVFKNTVPINNNPIPININSSSESDVSTSDEMTADEFWKEIAHLSWRDRSDQIMNDNIIKSKIKSRLRTTAEIIQFRDFIIMYMKKLNVPSETIASHIVGKGKDFYNIVLSDFEFASYLTETESQNLLKIVNTLCSE